MSNELQEVRVADMRAECAFLVVSHRCRELANTAVETPSGKMLWRCHKHRGMIDQQKTGPIHEVVWVRPEET